MSPKVPPRPLPPVGAPQVTPSTTPAKARAQPAGVRRRPKLGERPEGWSLGEGAEADAFERPERDTRDEAAPSAAQRQAGGGGGQAALAAPAARTSAPADGPWPSRALDVPPLPAFAAAASEGAAASTAAQGLRPRRAHADLDALARAVLARYGQAPAERRAQADALLGRLP